MSKKAMMLVPGIFLVCFLVTGICLKIAADNQKGVSVASGVMIDGEFKVTSSGTIGEDPKKYQMLDAMGNICYVMSGGLAIVCIVAFIGNSRSGKK